MTSRPRRIVAIVAVVAYIAVAFVGLVAAPAHPLTVIMVAAPSFIMAGTLLCLGAMDALRGTGR